MLRKIFKGQAGRFRSILSVMLCLALVCSVLSPLYGSAESETETSTETATETSTEPEATEASSETVTEASTEMKATETSSETVEESSAETGTQTQEQTETSAEDSSESGSEAETVTEASTESGSAADAVTTTAAAMPAVNLTGSADGVSVSVNAPEGAFAEGVTMVVSAVDVDAFEAAVLEDCEALGDTYTAYDAAAVDITFYDANGTEVQPASEVEVTLGGLNLATANENGEAEYALIYHMKDDGSVEWIVDGDPGESSYTFTASSFSTYGVVNVSVEYGISLTGPGDNWGGGDTSSSTIKVYYDRIVVNSSTSSTSITAQNDSQGISSVSISGGNATNNGTVAHESGKATSWSATTTSLTYNSSDTVTLTVTPTAGYYITYITVCCTGPKSNTVPTSCTTWGDGDAYNSTYSISDMGTISVSVNLNAEKGFKHDSNSGTYFVLIETAKIPSPLYVEYQYGSIVDYINEYNAENGTSLSSSVFTESADTWTDTYSGNVYGTTDAGVTNGVMTDDTQYKYTYATGSDSNTAGWYHYANSITDEAIAQAAAAGYYFAGWQATYYTTCSESTNASGSYNNYTYSFSSQYGTSSDYYQPGNKVALTVHVKLVAQWVKVEPKAGNLTITKSIEGLDKTAYPNGITFTVTNSSGETVGTVTLSSSNNWTATIVNLNPGTYTVSETSGYDVSGYSCTTSVDGETVNDKSTTVTLTYSVSKTLNTSTNLYDYTVTTTDGSVAFTNTYSKSTATLTVQKIIDGNMADSTKAFKFTVAYTDANGEAKTEEFDLVGGQSETSDTITVQLGSTVTITEDPDDNSGYAMSATLNGTNTDVTYNSVVSFDVIEEENAVVVKNYKNATPDTGINLDSAPYVVLLAAVLMIGAAFVITRRKRLL